VNRRARARRQGGLEHLQQKKKTPVAQPLPNLPGYQENRARVSLALSQFTVPLMSRIYHAFNGDMVAAIVLGEVAHRTDGAFLYLTSNVGDDFVDMTADTVDHLLTTARRLESLLANQPTPLPPLRLD
jgi:hypothetical protein